MGFEVDVGGAGVAVGGAGVAGGSAGAVGGDACARAQRLRGARSEWDGATRDGQSACGLPVAREAFRKLRDAWFTEVGAHATVLEQLCAALRESADTYQRTKAVAAASLTADLQAADLPAESLQAESLQAESLQAESLPVANGGQ